MQLPAHTDTSGAFRADFQGAVLPAFAGIINKLLQVKEVINKQLAEDCDKAGISRLLEKLDICGGKMLRPGLVLLAGEAVGKITDEHIRIAAIVEIIHNATLLHDDVIDEGQKRRGSPTINSLWGNESAVLLGDFLLSRVFKMYADLEPQIIKIIAATAVRVCVGELRQIIQKRNRQLSESEYIDIITEKSAAFFSSCCELGALLAQASKTQIRSLADFGLNVGIAFQITDDLLDIIGEESETGKTSGRDADKNKLTLAVIHLLRTVDEKEKGAVKNKLNGQLESKEALVEMLKRHGSLEYAHSRAKEFIEKAIASLDSLRDSNAKDALIKTAGFVTDRVEIRNL